MGVDDTYWVPDFGLKGSKTRWVSHMSKLCTFIQVHFFQAPGRTRGMYVLQVFHYFFSGLLRIEAVLPSAAETSVDNLGVKLLAIGASLKSFAGGANEALKLS